MAKDGDPVALRLCLDRIVPKLRGGPAVEIDLPRIRKASDVAEAMSMVIAAAAAGDLTLDEAKRFAELLDHHRSALETEELAVRIQLLEAEVARQVIELDKGPKRKVGL